MSKKRYEHSLKTMESAQSLARTYHVDHDRASVAALYHDLGKEYPKDKGLVLLKNYGLDIDDSLEEDYYLYHGLIGSLLAKSDFDIKDDLVLNAIRYHVMLVEDPTMLDKIIYLADMIEEGRDYPGVDEIRRLSHIDLDQALVKSLDGTIMNLVERGKKIHIQTIKSRNYLVNNV